MDFGGHIEKTRDSSMPAGSQVKMVLPDIELAGRDVILIDDIISSGETIIKAAVLLKKQHARQVLVGCVEGEFTAPEGGGVFWDEPVLGRNIDELTQAGLLSGTDKEGLFSKPIIDDLVSTDIIFNEKTSKVSIRGLIEQVARECRCM
jgi:hypothetical protein